MRPRWHANWEDEILRLPKVQDAEADAADRVVTPARARAPKRTGAGAASIHKEPIKEGGVVVGYRVSWDPEHDYMRFVEFGTEHITARPFLRPAASAAGR